jgi:ADP-ribosylglycohydrolase
MKETQKHINRDLLISDRISKAQGCLLGQLAGDALGSLVEFQSPKKIRQSYPNGVRNLIDGGTWNTIAGQPTDDSEMALLLARMLIRIGYYKPEEALKQYQYWLSSGPFDCGMTISAGLRGNLNHDSQANGALMRISPLGIFGANFELSQVAEWARQDALLTHPNLTCQQANMLFTMGISYAIQSGCSRDELYQSIENWAIDFRVESALLNTISKASKEKPADYVYQQGWVLIAFQNALYQLLHAPNLEEGIVDTIMQGGDTDTNAAICGALVGSVWGKEAIPAQWLGSLQECRPQSGNPRVFHPRPDCFWPADVLELAEMLVKDITYR